MYNIDDSKSYLTLTKLETPLTLIHYFCRLLCLLTVNFNLLRRHLSINK